MRSNRYYDDTLQDEEHSNKAADTYALNSQDGTTLYVEIGDDYIAWYEDRSRRMLFVRKVLGAVGLQFLVSACFIALCQFEPNLNGFFKSAEGRAIGGACSFAWLALFIAIACCNVGRGKPNVCNISLLFISTALMSTMLGQLTVRYDTFSILIAAGTTVAVVLVLSLITFHTKFDITNKGWWILGAFVALLIFSLIATILLLCGVIPLENKVITIISLVISCLMTMLFAVLILYRLQLIVGRGKYKYEEDDWLVASITLFYEIVQFFLEILKLVGFARG